MADLRARYESWREARERLRLERALGAEPDGDAERIDGEFGDVTGGAAVERAEGRFRLGLVQAALASELRALDARIAARARAEAEPEELDELRAERVAERSRALARLGFARARSFAEALRPGVDYDAWRSESARYLAQSDSLLRDAERGPGSGSSFGSELPGSRLRAALDHALAGMGLDLGRLPGLTIDGPRPGLAGPAFSIAPRVPGDVWLELTGAGGLGACGELFSAAGQAAQAAITSPELPLEKRVLGDPALAAGFGELWRALASEIPLGAELARVTPEHFAAAARRARIERLQSAAGRVATELWLAELDPGSAPGAWQEPGYLARAGPALTSVDSLRAAAFGMGAARLLRGRFGREYWKTRGAGTLLLELWNTGTTYGLEELARELRLGALGADALLEDDRTP
ncbi:MAG TPA: hypothetical protein VMR86_08395 [Myxococcota bacterium]|nr:hypothetical protein [Myxococcota bacterium]